MQVHGYAQRLKEARVEQAPGGVWGWAAPLFEGFVILALLYMCSLVIIGMKSRCALTSPNQC